MKLKEWKQKLKEHQFNIPDIYESIKPYAYRKRIKYDPLPMNPLIKKKMLFAPLYLIIILFFLVLFSTDNRYRDQFLIGDNLISYFSDTAEINNYRQEYFEESILYQYDYRQIVSFNATSETDKAIIEYPKTSLNEYLEDSLTVKVEGNYIYMVTPAAFNVIDTAGGNLKLIYSKSLSKLPENEGFAEMHITDEYIIVIFTDRYTGHQEINKSTHIIIFDKQFDSVYEYSVSGKYLDSFLVKNKLYLFNQLPLNSISTSSDEIILPEITENSLPKKVTPNDIAYIKGFGSKAYTVITYLDLGDKITSKDEILLSYEEWKQIYVTEKSIYLINNHQNTDDKLEYGTYTAIIHFDIDSGLSYGNSVKFKGTTLNKLACDEYNGYFRIAITDVDYKIIKNFLQTKINPNSFKNKILVLKETGNRSLKQMQLVSAIEISTNEHLEGVKFDGTKAYALAVSGKLYVVNFNNPSLPKLENPPSSDNVKLFYYQLNEDTAFTINSDPAISGYKLSFYDLNKEETTPWRQDSFEIKYSDYAYFPVLEAVNNRNAIFAHRIKNRYYLGFSVTNFNRTRGNYYLFEIDTASKTYKPVHFEFSENAHPNRMVVDETNKLIFALSDKIIAAYDESFEKVDILILK